MRTYLALFFLAALASASFAGEIKNGATMQVKTNSIWFEQSAQLAQWQAVKKRGNAKALAAYEDNVLRQREAWQFTNAQAVTILGFEPEKNRVHVKMQTTGRLENSKWFVDPGAIKQ